MKELGTKNIFATFNIAEINVFDKPDHLGRFTRVIQWASLWNNSYFKALSCMEKSSLEGTFKS